MNSLAWALWRARWRQQPLQLLVTVLVVALGVALAYAVQLINSSALAEFGQAVRSVNGQPDAVLRATGAPGLDEAVFARLAQRPEVAAASPVLEIDTLAVDAQGRRVAVRVLGIDALRVLPLSPDLLPRPADGEPRLTTLDPQAAFLNPAARLALGRPRAGSPLALQSGDRLQTWRDAGEVAAAGAPLIVMDLAGAQAGFGQLGRLTRIDLRLAAGSGKPADVGTALLASLPPAERATLRLAQADESVSRASQLSLCSRWWRCSPADSWCIRCNRCRWPGRCRSSRCWACWGWMRAGAAGWFWPKPPAWACWAAWPA